METKPPKIRVMLDFEGLKTASKHVWSKAAQRDLHLALQSLGKRQDYSLYYYRTFRRVVSQKSLEANFCGDDGSEILRIKFEALHIAFLQNIHSACDALPYALNLLLGGIDGKGEGYDETFFKWDKKLPKMVEGKIPSAEKLIFDLTEFMTNKNFLILKTLVNSAKHQYLHRLLVTAPLQDEEFSIVYENFSAKSYDTSSPVIHVNSLDVRQFMKTCHDELLHRLFLLYVEISKLLLEGTLQNK